MSLSLALSNYVCIPVSNPQSISGKHNGITIAMCYAVNKYCFLLIQGQMDAGRINNTDSLNWCFCFYKDMHALA